MHRVEILLHSTPANNFDFWSFDYGSCSRHLLLLLVLNANSFEEIALAEISHHLSFGFN
jgi:hypothetical protein